MFSVFWSPNVDLYFAYSSLMVQDIVTCVLYTGYVGNKTDRQVDHAVIAQ